MAGAGSENDVRGMQFPPEGFSLECNRPRVLVVVFIWILRLCGIAMIGMGCFVSSFALEIKVLTVCVGVVLWAAAEIYARQTRLKRFWLNWHADWFSVRTRSGEQTYRQDQIIGTSLALKDKTVDTSSNLIATRRYSIWVDEGMPPIRFVERVHSAKPDLLQPFIELTEKRFVDCSEAVLAAGGSVVGGNPPNDWTVNSRMLVLHHGDHGQVLEVPLASLVDVALTDGHVCVWQKGESRPFFKVEESSINAHVLLNWLVRQLPEDDASQGPDVTRPGRLIFERKPAKGVPVFLYVLGVIAMLVGVVVTVVEPKMFVLIPVLAIVGGLIMFVGWVTSRQGFECYENKLRQRQFMNYKELEYHEIEHFTCQITHNFVNGGYTGTLFRMVMEPFRETGKGKFTYGCTIKAFDKTLESLRDHIAALVAVRMKNILESGVSVAWTPGVTFMPQGIHRAKKVFSKEVFLPYDKIIGFNMQQGTFHIFAQGSDKPILSMTSSERNFFPGMFLVGELTSGEVDEVDIEDTHAPGAAGSQGASSLPHGRLQGGQDATFGQDELGSDDRFG